MYSSQEISRVRKSVWTAFGQYMSLHLSADGEKINWVNYKTGLKQVNFKMMAGNSNAVIAIEITHPDSSVRFDYFLRLLQLKKVLEQYVGEQWLWVKDMTDENGKPVSRIYRELSSANVNNKEDWPAIISFFKPRLIALEEFWTLAR